MGGFFLEYANFEEANNLKTPEHIAPVWYFTPFYAILRAVTIDIGPLDSKFLGLVAMGAAIAILFVLPWLDRARVNSMRYKGDIARVRSEEHTSELQSRGHLVCRLLLEKKTISYL